MIHQKNEGEGWGINLSQIKGEYGNTEKKNIKKLNN